VCTRVHMDHIVQESRRVWL